jgi:hypothetical protein
MYQSLIWAAVLRHGARRLRAPLDTEDCEGLADALVDGVRGDPQLGGDFLRIEMLIDQPQAIELARREPCDSLRHHVVTR